MQEFAFADGDIGFRQRQDRVVLRDVGQAAIAQLDEVGAVLKSCSLKKAGD